MINNSDTPRKRLRIGGLVCMLTSAMLLAPTRTQGQQASATAPTAPTTHTVTIPGTVVSFDLVRLPAAPDANTAPGAPSRDGGDADADTHADTDGDTDASESTGTSRAIWMTASEVTWDAFDVFLYKLDRDAELPTAAGGAQVDAIARPTTPYIAVDRGFGHSGFPALSVSARNATTYCAWLSSVTGLSFRLPSVGEWQRACRAGGPEPNANKESLAAVAWYRGNARYKTHAVAGKPANAWGLHDLQGNVSEWARADDGRLVLMGGSYLDGLSDCPCDRLREDTPDWNASDPNLPKSMWWLADGSFVGFRVVCDSPLRAPQPRSGATQMLR